MADPYTQAAMIAAPYANLGQQMFQGANMREQGYQKQMLQNAQRGAFEGHANLYNAQAQKAAEEASGLAQRRQYQTPEFSSQAAAATLGIAPEVATLIQTGGNHGLSPETVQRYNMLRGSGMLGLNATGDGDSKTLVDTFVKLLGSSATPQQSAVLGQGIAASEGKPIYHQGNNGTMNNFTGVENLNAVGKTSAQQNAASAANSYASADQHRASAASTRAKMNQPTTNPDGSVTAPAGKPIKLSATAEKELFEADDNIKAGNSTIGLLKVAKELNDKAYSGYFAKTRATLRSNLPGESEQANATVELDNIMTTQALESLKTTFGAAPTEGERKILLDIQASADKTPAQRKAIIDRAIKASEQRLIFNTNKANSLRNGTHNFVDPQAAQKPSVNNGWSIKEVGK